MNVSSKLTASALLILSLNLTLGCQTEKPLLTTTGTSELVTSDEWKKSDAPILLSRSDVLTEGTLAQIENHNRIYFCRFPDKRPQGFDVAVCGAP